MNLMSESILLGLIFILALGTLAQWLGWRFSLPSILLLLGAGLLAGPFSTLILEDQFLQPDVLFGDLILPAVSLGVAIILFEGGLTLNWRELRESGGTIFRLVTIGALVCWFLATFLAIVILDLDLGIATLFGAVLVITGPTVIGPMLRQIRPRGRINHVLKWEGILNDPVGAVLGVLVLEAILISGISAAPEVVVIGILKTLVIGIVIGSVTAGFLVFAFRRSWVPDYLHNSVTLASVLVAFGLSNVLQYESGLLTVTLMGIILANQRSFSVRHIIEFKENLQVLLISGLFIVLAARVDLETLTQVGWKSLVFLVALIVIVRPASVLSATVGSTLSWKERIFLMLMAPRGIVVTSLASLFAFRLESVGYAGADRMFAEMIFVILGTVLFYGLAAGVGARVLGLANPNPMGLLFVGAHPWARMIAVGLKQHEIPVILIDANAGNVQAARDAGLTAYAGNIHSEEFIRNIDFSNISKVLALTANEEVNAFAQQELAKFVGRTQVYKLDPSVDEAHEASSKETTVKEGLFSKGLTYEKMEKLFYSGSTVQSVALRDGLDYSKFQGTYGLKSIPLFVRDNNTLQVISTKNPVQAKEGSVIIYLTLPNKSEGIIHQKTPGGDEEKA
ncbi:MAG: cation:proton antiporter [Opitutales bacterium]